VPPATRVSQFPNRINLTGGSAQFIRNIQATYSRAQRGLHGFSGLHLTELEKLACSDMSRGLLA
jgi:hypothetical protein